MDEFEKMRSLIRLVEVTDSYNIVEFQEPEMEIPMDTKSLKDDLIALIEKLNNHYESEDNEKSLGIEEGMQRAAQMIENLLAKHGE